MMPPPRVPAAVDDSALLAGIRAGDASAFDALFRNHYAALVGFTASIVRDVAAAEDVVQEVMLELWRRREQLPVADSVRGYLFRSARNRALNVLRHEEIVRQSEPLILAGTPDAVAPADDAGDDRLSAAIAAAVAALPAPVRECFVLSREQGLTYPEIAAALEISVKTVEARMGRALKELRERLAAWRTVVRA